MASALEIPFHPQPGDIILLQSPVTYADGTWGPLVKIYKDDFFFTPGNSLMMHRPSKHIPKRGERILRLYKLYQNWEFVSCKNQELYVHYPGVDKEKDWHLAQTVRNEDHLSQLQPPCLPLVTLFTHIPPSKLFCSLPTNAFSPRQRDLIIRRVPIPATKISTQKCADCKRKEHDAQYWSRDANNPGSARSVPYLRPNSEGCYNCRVPRSKAKSMPVEMHWANRWELLHWSENFQPQHGDVLVRHEIDTQYGGGRFKKTHLQVEIFGYAGPLKVWKYFGMDVAQLGPLVQIHDIVYRPQPGDIIISTNQKWSLRGEPRRHSGGWVMLHKDVSHFGDSEGGQNLWRNDHGEGDRPGNKKTPTDCWVVRLGFFDEYWDYHFNDRADVFVMHPNGETMLLHYSTDYPYVGQPPHYIYEIDHEDPPLLAEVEVVPNHWDLIARRVERVHEDPLKTRDWKPDPHHWMRDRTLWGRDVPPRFDKEVEMFTYWSGFEFEDGDFLLRAGFALIDKNEARQFGEDFLDSDSPGQGSSGGPFGPPNPSIPPFHTNASVELYQVKVEEEELPKFIFFGRDQYSFPDEYAPETIVYVDDDSPPADKPKEKVAAAENVRSRDSHKGKIKEPAEAGGAGLQVQSNVVEGQSEKTLKLVGADEVALP